jgi:hypothetical protein
VAKTNRDTIGVRWLWWPPAKPVAYEHELVKSNKSERSNGPCSTSSHYDLHPAFQNDSVRRRSHEPDFSLTFQPDLGITPRTQEHLVMAHIGMEADLASLRTRVSQIEQERETEKKQCAKLGIVSLWIAIGHGVRHCCGALLLLVKAI